MDITAFDRFWLLIQEKLQTWAELGIKHLPNIAVAIVIAIVFGLLSRLIGRIVQQLLRRSIESRQIADLFTAVVKVAVIIVGLFIALEFVGLTGTVTSLLAGAGIVGLAIGFAFQDMTENLIAGIAMGIRKPFQIDDVIEADGVFGKVRAINLRNTLVETFFGQVEIVPNKILFRNILTNYSKRGIRRLEIPVGISYADDIETAAEVITTAINQLDFVIKQDETAVYATEFGASSINLVVWFWLEYPGDESYMNARHLAIVTINNVLKEHDILIPFPIRTLDFGAKGGEKLANIVSQYQASNSSSAN
ncbi:mechanosensitive ion channel family protein [Alteromonas flava]|uniref:mechanosensitive ion channel family protein n=1 Tax=Alteromonas flava TaxID=2048003 RepID=UPI000C292422|nr:mechanosensitive ion channel family protein [Alteromonas flava]